MKRAAAVVLCVALILAGCGSRSAESVVKDLDGVLGGLKSYQGKGTMTLHTGQQPLQYQVEVWYKKPSYYRVALTNAAKDITQIVLRNDEGVFVLTPKLRKSFRFQSDWPQNQGQVYLYQTLVQSILLDNSRQFAIDKDAYVFDVMANYQNGSLARQKIWLDQKTYAPRRVEVSDANANVMVEVTFDQFRFDVAFDDKAFDMAANLGTAQQQEEQDKSANAPGSGEEDAHGTHGEQDRSATDDAAPGDNPDEAATDDVGPGDNPDETATDDAFAGDVPDEAADAGETADDFVPMEPSYYPEGVALKDISDVTLADGSKGVLMRFTGAYNYTLYQTKPKDIDAALIPGVMLDLGHTWGLLTGDVQQTLTWTYQGYEYRLTSAELPESEMVKIAQSVLEEMEK
jgi:outer membrane lipoprotein-sorting protein